MDIELIDTFEKFQELAPVWNKALADSDNDIPFMTFEWFWSWWSIYGRDNDLLVAVVREEGEILAIAPLLRTRTALLGLPVKMLLFIDNSHSDCVGMIIRKEQPGLLRAILARLSASHYRFDMALFNGVAKGSATERLLRLDLGMQEMPWMTEGGKTSPYILIDGTWEEYYKGRSKNVRHKLNRISNALQRRGNYEIVEYADDDIERGLKEMMEVSRNSWKFKNKTAIVSNTENIRFFSLLAGTMAPRGWFRLWVLKIDGEPAAFQYALLYKGRLHGIKTDFDEKHSSLCPGKFLAKHIVQQCFEEGIREFNLLGQNESYKMDWTSLCREHAKYLAFSTSLYGRLLYTLKSRILPGIRAILSLTSLLQKSAFTRTRGEMQG